MWSGAGGVQEGGAHQGAGAQTPCCHPNVYGHVCEQEHIHHCWLLALFVLNRATSAGGERLDAGVLLWRGGAGGGGVGGGRAQAWYPRMRRG